MAGSAPKVSCSSRYIAYNSSYTACAAGRGVKRFAWSEVIFPCAASNVRYRPAATAAEIAAPSAVVWAWQELESRVPDTEVTAAQPAQVPAEVMEQLVTHKVEPQYPASARQANLQGTVLLDTLIGQDGTVVKVKPVSGPEALASAAMEAVRWWRFQPYQLNGQPAEVETTVAVEFRP